jgi:hypothetical protein
VIFCNWDREKLTSVAAQLDRDSEFIALQLPAASTADRRFIHYTSAVFDVIKRAIQSHSQQTKKSVFLQVVVPNDIESIQLQGIAGVLKTARKEHSHFAGQLIALDPTLAASTIVRRLHENFLRPADTLVRYAGGKVNWALGTAPEPLRRSDRDLPGRMAACSWSPQPALPDHRSGTLLDNHGRRLSYCRRSPLARQTRSTPRGPGHL